MTAIRVIGCGNPDAGDDAAGILAVELAREELEAFPGVEVVARASPLDVVHLLHGADALVVVDAIRTPGASRAVGSIVTAVAGPRGLPVAVRSSLSSHGLGVAEAFGLAAAIGTVPEVVVVGIEVAETVAGRPMSPAVRAALPGLAEAIVREAGGAVARAEGSPAGGSTGPGRGGNALAR
jgi:hydrogenase maturation protease